MRRRSSEGMGPIWDRGGSTQARSTGRGTPLGSSRETRASPTSSSVRTFSASTRGFCRKVWAAARTAF